MGKYVSQNSLLDLCENCCLLCEICYWVLVLLVATFGSVLSPIFGFVRPRQLVSLENFHAGSWHLYEINCYSIAHTSSTNESRAVFSD